MTTRTWTVTGDDTAVALGSGDVPVLGTPRLLAWMEAATVAAAAAHLTGQETSVGVEVALRHRRASAVGATVKVQVGDVRRDGGRLYFAVVAHEVTDPAAAGGLPPIDPSAGLVASATITRAVVDRTAFLARLGGR